MPTTDLVRKIDLKIWLANLQTRSDKERAMREVMGIPEEANLVFDPDSIDSTTYDWQSLRHSTRQQYRSGFKMFIVSDADVDVPNKSLTRRTETLA